MKSSRTPKSIQRAQREETRKERHSVKNVLNKYRSQGPYGSDPEMLQRVPIRYEDK